MTMKQILCILFVLLSLNVASAQPSEDYASKKIELLKKHANTQVHFVPLEIGEIKPEGWIRDWAVTAVNGITGHLDEYQPVYQHGWRGYGFKARGTNPEDGTRWPIEQCSYWLDGAIKLAYMLNDEALIRKVSQRLDIVIDGVMNGGETFIYWKPKTITNDPFNNWGHGIMGRALMDYYQATHNPRILTAINKVYSDFRIIMPNFSATNLDGMMWLMRGATNVDAMTEAYLESGDKTILKSLKDYANNEEIKKYESILSSVKGRDDTYSRSLHGVTLYEGLRVPAILNLWRDDASGYNVAEHLHDWAMEYNELPYGMPSCEEWMSGVGGLHSVETCVVPASMWTYNWMMRISGDTKWADLIESVFFNAGPAPVSRDFKTMSYYQQPNRFSETLPSDPPVPGEGSNKFTPYGHEVLCCVGSSNWIIPNYVGNMWQATMDGGLALLLYGPCSVNTVIGSTKVGIRCETNYPFSEEVNVRLSLSKSKKMPLYFNVPSWCKGMQIKVDGKEQNMTIVNGMICLQRKWKDGDVISISLPMTLTVKEGREVPYPRDKYFTAEKHVKRNPLIADSIGGMPYEYIKHGPLLYALPLKDISENEVMKGQKYNYALNVADLDKDIKVSRHAMPTVWKWDMQHSPVTMTVRAREFDWHPTQAFPMPKEKVTGDKDAQIELIPYCLTKFRVSMFPVAKH